MMVQVLTVMLNAVLAPVLIAGWGTGHAMGVAGAGLASSLSVGVGVVLLAVYFHRLEKYVAFRRRRIASAACRLGPVAADRPSAGGEFALMFLYMAVIYWNHPPPSVGRPGRVRHRPAGHAKHVLRQWRWHSPRAAIVGQFCRGKFARVRETFALASDRQLHMVILTLSASGARHGSSTGSPRIRRVGPVGTVPDGDSWNFLASDSYLRCSAVFQGLGHRCRGAELGEPHRELRRTGALARRRPQFQLLQLWVCLGGERHAASDLESLAGARRISAARAVSLGIARMTHQDFVDLSGWMAALLILGSYAMLSFARFRLRGRSING